MIKNKNYIKEIDQEILKSYVELLEPGEKARIKYIMMHLKNEYACFEIMQYIRSLGVPKDKIFHGEADYIVTLPRGHVQLVNDLYFNNCYLHQYNVCKELDISIEQVQKYIIHHENMVKGSNDISNLYICYDQAMHQAYHMAIKHGDINIKEFTLNYVDSIMNKDNVEEIRQYLEILDKLEKVKKDKKIL